MRCPWSANRTTSRRGPVSPSGPISMEIHEAEASPSSEGRLAVSQALLHAVQRFAVCVLACWLCRRPPGPCLYGTVGKCWHQMIGGPTLGWHESPLCT